MTDTRPQPVIRDRQADGPGRPRPSVPTGLVFWQLAALAGQVLAVWLARDEYRGPAEVISSLSFAAAYGSALWVLLRPQLSRTARNAAVACLAVTPALMWRATNPLVFTAFDEQLHMRTLTDVISGESLFSANPLLQASARYPGLEAITALVHQFGLPVMAAATTVLFVARLALAVTLCDAVEQLTGSARAGGLAVAAYAVSPQFIMFNSQFSYQTVALPLGLAAVSLIARARHATDPVALYGGATLCLLALAMTHHLTSFLTASFLMLWSLVEKGRGRISVTYGALAALASALLWALVQYQVLEGYLGPIASEFIGNLAAGARRTPFSDGAGTASPVLDRILLIYYAAGLCLAVAAMVILTRRMWPTLRHRRQHLLLLAMAASIPVLLAARVLPRGGQYFERLSSFLFLPFSLLVAGFAVALFWRKAPAAEQHSPTRRQLTVQVVTVVLASAMFVGGFILGSGPAWARLPGAYMAAADTRSIDAETLAATDWAGRSLPAGSRIGADRVASTLLASKAKLWPVMKGPGTVDVAALYVAPAWTETESDMARSMRLRYLYVDQRLALEKPPYGFYFYNGETGEGQQLTGAQLTKFDSVPGIEAVYRHGPVTIYDLRKLGIAVTLSGRSAITPQNAMLEEIVLGTMIGLMFVLLRRSRLWPHLVRTEKSIHAAAGPALTMTVILASACLAAIAMLLAQLWPSRLALLSAVVVIVLTMPRRAVARVRRALRALSWQRGRPVIAIAVALALIIGTAVFDASGEVHSRVQQILDRTIKPSSPSPTKPPG